jgi:hypothetical protein
MNIKLVFYDWQDHSEKSVYDTHGFDGPGLALGPFHHGTTFDAHIDLTAEEEEEFSDAMLDGFTPVFKAFIPRKT